MSQALGGKRFPRWGKRLISFLIANIIFAVPVFSAGDPTGGGADYTRLPPLVVDIPDGKSQAYVNGYGLCYNIHSVSTYPSANSWQYIVNSIPNSLSFDKIIPNNNSCTFFPFWGLTTNTMNDASRIVFQTGYTYDIEFALNSASYGAITREQIYFMNSKYIDGSGGVDPHPFLYPFNEYCPNYSITYDTSTQYMIKYHLVFTCPTLPSTVDFDIFTIDLERAFYTGGQFSFNFIRGMGYYDMDQTIYQELVLSQFEDIKKGLDKNNQSLQNVENAVEAGNRQSHQDAEDLKNNLDTIDKSVIEGNQQAHQDAEALQNKLEDMQNQEKEEATKNGDASEGDAAIKSALSIDQFKSSVDTLFSALSYTGTDSSWTLPASGNIPYVGELWEEKQIDFTFWINALPSSIKYVINFIFVIGCVYLIIFDIKSLIKIFNKGDDE